MQGGGGGGGGGGEGGGGGGGGGGDEGASPEVNVAGVPRPKRIGKNKVKRLVGQRWKPSTDLYKELKIPLTVVKKKGRKIPLIETKKKKKKSK